MRGVSLVSVFVDNGTIQIDGGSNISTANTGSLNDFRLTRTPMYICEVLRQGKRESRNKKLFR